MSAPTGTSHPPPSVPGSRRGSKRGAEALFNSCPADIITDAVETSGPVQPLCRRASLGGAFYLDPDNDDDEESNDRECPENEECDEGCNSSETTKWEPSSATTNISVSLAEPQSTLTPHGMQELQPQQQQPHQLHETSCGITSSMRVLEPIFPRQASGGGAHLSDCDNWETSTTSQGSPVLRSHTPGHTLMRMQHSMQLRTQLKTQALANESRAIARSDNVLRSLPSFSTMCADLPHLDVNMAMIGLGATSKVYSAVERSSQMTVVIKVTSRFFGQEESSKLRQVGYHPHIVRLYDVIERDHTTPASSPFQSPNNEGSASKRYRSLQSSCVSSAIHTPRQQVIPGSPQVNSPVLRPTTALSMSESVHLIPGVAMMDDPLAKAPHLLFGSNLPPLGGLTPLEITAPLPPLPPSVTHRRLSLGRSSIITTACTTGSTSVCASTPPSPVTSISVIPPTLDGGSSTSLTRMSLLSPGDSPRSTMIRRIGGQNTFRASLSPSNFGTPSAPVHARRNAAFAASLRSPHLVSYLVLEHLAGGALVDVLAEHQSMGKRVSDELIRHVLRSTASALQHLHHLRIVMNDVTPENIMFAAAVPSLPIMSSPLPQMTSLLDTSNILNLSNSPRVVTSIQPPMSPVTMACRQLQSTRLNDKIILHPAVSAPVVNTLPSSPSTFTAGHTAQNLLQTTVKLIDLGNAMPAGEVVGLKWIHPRLRAPEMAWISAQQHATLARTYEPPVDIWALGVVAVEMMLGRHAFEYDREFSLTQDHIKFDLHRLLTREVESFRHIYPQLVPLVHQLLAWNPADRPTAAQLLQHSFLQ